MLRALRESLPAAELGALPQTEHLSEFLVSRLDDARGTEPGDAAVAYHDPCALGRRARRLDAPREVIRKVTGAPPVEFLHARAIAECCGEGGLLPEVDPDLAARMAVAQLERLPDGVTTLVTACPGCRSQLGAAALRARASIEVTDISELVVARLGLRQGLSHSEETGR